MHGILKPTHFRDLGNLMLAFVMLWAYTTFSEFLLIWYGNIKEEIPHYLHAQHGVWGCIAVALVLFHFFLPFTMLLMRADQRPAEDDRHRHGDHPGHALRRHLLAGRAGLRHGAALPLLLDHDLRLPRHRRLWLAASSASSRARPIIPIHETWVEEAIREGALKTSMPEHVQYEDDDLFNPETHHEDSRRQRQRAALVLVIFIVFAVVTHVVLYFMYTAW